MHCPAAVRIGTVEGSDRPSAAGREISAKRTVATTILCRVFPANHMRRMFRVDLRDIGMTVLFGAASSWLWGSLIGALSAATQFPILVSLSREFGARVTPWVPAYMFAWEIIGGGLCALVIALPLGYLLRQHIWPMWAIFATFFVGGLAVSALLGDDLSLFLLVFRFPGPWVFLAWSALFVVVGHRLRMHRHVA